MTEYNMDFFFFLSQDKTNSKIADKMNTTPPLLFRGQYLRGNTCFEPDCLFFVLYFAIVFNCRLRM